VGQRIADFAVEEIESSLGQIAEVTAARVVASPDGGILEIHVLSTTLKSPKQLVRDIESTLMAGFNIAVDHKKISIAQLGGDTSAASDEAPVPGRDEQGARPRIHAINASVSGLYSDAAVTLEVGGELYDGRASAPSSQTGRQRIIAQATLNAVSMVTNGSHTFALEDVAIIRLGREEVAVSCVTIVSPLGEQSFTGSAMVRQNEKDSIVRATLDAINRRMGFLTTA